MAYFNPEDKGVKNIKYIKDEDPNKREYHINIDAVKPEGGGDIFTSGECNEIILGGNPDI